MIKRAFWDRLVVLAVVSGILLTGCGRMIVPSHDVAPTVSSTSPAGAETGVPVNRRISVVFSEAVRPETITAEETFFLYQGTTVVPGTLAYSGLTAIFTPASALAANTTYVATITTGAKDLAGNPLSAAKTWSFTTGTGSDTAAPVVTATTPADLSTGVPTNRKIGATFSEALETGTIASSETFSLKQGTAVVPGIVTYAGVGAVFTPASALAANTTYVATIATGAKDLAGNPLSAAKTWSFTTGTGVDTAAPSVVSTAPADLATNEAINGNITANFDEALDPLLVSTATFILMDGTMTVEGAVMYDGQVATFIPVADLATNTIYVATINAGVQDLAGNPLPANKTWSFKTRR